MFRFLRGTSVPQTGGVIAGSQAQAAQRRALVAERLRATVGVVGFYGHDPLLTTLAGLRRQRHDLDAAMRRLLAYGREFTRPRHSQGVAYGSQPNDPTNGRIDHPLSERGLFFLTPDGHLFELMASYSGQA